MSAVVDLVPIKPEVLAVRTIPRADPQLAAQLKLRPEQVSVGMLTATLDDALYTALDEGTKAARVEVVYARSFYAGSAHASGPLSGECIGIYAAADPDEVRAALAAAVRCLEQDAWFYAADERGELGFFPQVIASTGSYLSREAGIERGAPMAYLIAPPLESLIGLDAALKAAPLRLAKWFGPPSETNYGGGYLVGGDLPACEAAARAFATAVVDVARAPRADGRAARAAGEELGARPTGPAAGAGRYRVLATGERLSDKPEHLTHLCDDQSLVEKIHPRIVLRGKLDTLQALLLEAQCLAEAEALPGLVGDLGELLDHVRGLLGAEVTERPAPAARLLGLDAAGLRHASHHTRELYGVPFVLPTVRLGPMVARLNLCRAYAREAELAAHVAFPPPKAGNGGGGAPTRVDLTLALNRLSSALYVLTCKHLGGKYDDTQRPAGPLSSWRPPQQ